jgi:putative membrane protein
MGFLARTAINAFALWVATEIVPGIEVSGVLTLVIAAVVFGVVNALVRPVAFWLSLPLTVITLGLFLFVLNAAMLGLTALLSPGFRIEGFWPAVFGAIVVAVVAWIAGRVVGGGEGAASAPR